MAAGIPPAPRGRTTCQGRVLSRSPRLAAGTRCVALVRLASSWPARSLGVSGNGAGPCFFTGAPAASHEENNALRSSPSLRPPDGRPFGGSSPLASRRPLGESTGRSTNEWARGEGQHSDGRNTAALEHYQAGTPRRATAAHRHELCAHLSSEPGEKSDQQELPGAAGRSQSPRRRSKHWKPRARCA